MYGSFANGPITLSKCRKLLMSNYKKVMYFNLSEWEYAVVRILDKTNYQNNETRILVEI